MSQFHSELRSVPLGRSVHGPVTYQLPVPMTLSTFLHGVEGVSSRGLSRQPCSLSFPLPEMSWSRLIRLEEFCYAFPQCLHVASRVSISWYRSLLLRAQVARAVLDQPCTSEIAFSESEIEFFISSTGSFIHFQTREEVEESSDRWETLDTWTMRSSFLAQMACFATCCCWSQRDRASFRATAQFGLRCSLRPFLMSRFLAGQVLTQLDLLRYREGNRDLQERALFLAESAR